MIPIPGSVVACDRAANRRLELTPSHSRQLGQTTHRGRAGAGSLARLTLARLPLTTSDRELGLLSVVAPMLNEAQNVREFYLRLTGAISSVPFELVIVDDGSTDQTPALLDELAERDPRVKVLHLSRSFGHQIALTAGLDHASGDAVVMMDGDLQDPPEAIPLLLERWKEGADVVVARRRVRPGETRVKLATSRWFYSLIGRLAQIDLEPNAGDFRLISRQALEVLLEMRERSRFLRGMTSWVGFEQTVVEYDREARFAGEIKYTYTKLLRLAIDGVSAFSNVPLQLATLIGLGFAALAFIGLPLTVVARYAGIYVPGISSVLFVILLIGGIQLLTLGVIGEYVGRIYDEVKRRPLYVVSQRRNLRGARRPERVEEDVSVG